MQLATEFKNFTCICCPLGCELEAAVNEKGELEELSGYLCAQGKSYAEEESVAPRRMICAVVCIEGSREPLSVKTASPVPKERIPAVLSAIRALALKTPIKAGAVLLADVDGTGVSLLATKTLQKDYWSLRRDTR
ncbi:MAG: DUF1667 domain-containing protein [Coriobacteriales bacterium]|jgi:CxxC motif-containing protein|nr:DUF1667 domain-containing protein [Coriobacteriales bacterium]